MMLLLCVVVARAGKALRSRMACHVSKPREKGGKMCQELGHGFRSSCERLGWTTCDTTLDTMVLTHIY